MAGLKTARANAILDSEMSGTRQLRLYTVLPTPTANGTEMAGASYAPQTIAFAAASGGFKVQSADVIFSTATADYSGPIVAWAITDTGGVQYAFRPIPPQVVLSGDVVTFSAGTVVLGLA